MPCATSCAINMLLMPALQYRTRKTLWIRRPRTSAAHIPLGRPQNFIFCRQEGTALAHWCPMYVSISHAIETNSFKENRPGEAWHSGKSGGKICLGEIGRHEASRMNVTRIQEAEERGLYLTSGVCSERLPLPGSFLTRQGIKPDSSDSKE